MGKATCGSGENIYTYEKVNAEIESQLQQGSTLLVLPLATIIEAGNHIAQCGKGRYRSAQAFADIVIHALDGQSPWAIFSHQNNLWETEKLRNLITRWRSQVVQSEHSLGDASIVDVAFFYHAMGHEVTIFTADAGLKAYEPVHQPPLPVPRRRKNRP